MMLSSEMLTLAALDLGFWDALRDVLVLLSAALVLGTLAQRLGQSPIVGYLIAGTLVGPSMLGWIGKQQEIFSIAELGVALLLFVIGLEFSPKRLMELGTGVLNTGILQILLTGAGTFAVARLCGLGSAEALIVGMMVAMSSTASVLRLLVDRGEIDSQAGRISLGILLVQDVAVVPMMLVVSAMAGGETPWVIGGRVLLSLVLALVLIGFFYVLFQFVIPQVLSQLALQGNRDLPILLAMILALGSAWSAHALGLSPALGAFAAGVWLAVSPFATQIRADVRPVSTLLVTLFFASIGMFGDPNWLLGNWRLVSGIVFAIVVGKPLVIALLARLFRQSWRYSIIAALSLGQVGEFSFVLATIARTDAAGVGVLSETTFRALISATIVTLLLTPYLVSAAPVIGAWAARTFSPRTSAGGIPRTDTAAMPGGEHETAARRVQALIIGFGPAGQRVAEGLMDQWQDSLSVLDMNPDNVGVAYRYGLRGLTGDASQRDVLEHAGIRETDIVVLALPDHRTTREIIFLVRDLAPAAHIVARSRYHVKHWELLMAGAHEVVDEEDQVGRRLAIYVRRALDAAAGTAEAGDQPA